MSAFLAAYVIGALLMASLTSLGLMAKRLRWYEWLAGAAFWPVVLVVGIRKGLWP